LVWTDARLKEIAARFIPAAEACDRLQAGKDEDCLLFQRFADRGHCQSPGGTRQGTYVATPSGRLLASANSPDPREIERVLRKGLEEWEKLSRSERLLPEPPRAELAAKWRPWDSLYPADGLVLRVFCRDLHREKVPSQFLTAWNQDYAWFRKEEARGFLPGDPAPGATREVPRELVERLARFHLLDSVRASTEPFPKEAVREAGLTSTVVGRQGQRLSLRFEGRTRAAESGVAAVQGGERTTLKEERGFEARLLGRGSYDLTEERFVSFELLALGKRWGATVCNMRVGDLDTSRMGVLLTLAGPGKAERLPPAFVSHYGWKR